MSTLERSSKSLMVQKFKRTSAKCLKPLNILNSLNILRMDILVTGSAGMIGGYVVKGLLEKGHTVIGVDRVKPKEEMEGLTSVVLD